MEKKNPEYTWTLPDGTTESDTLGNVQDGDDIICTVTTTDRTATLSETVNPLWLI